MTWRQATQYAQALRDQRERDQLEETRGEVPEKNETKETTHKGREKEKAKGARERDREKDKKEKKGREKAPKRTTDKDRKKKERKRRRHSPSPDPVKKTKGPDPPSSPDSEGPRGTPRVRQTGPKTFEITVR